MVREGDRIPCVIFEDGSVELFHDYAGARAFALLYIGTKQIVDVESFGENCKTVTFIDGCGYESFIHLGFKVVG